MREIKYAALGGAFYLIEDKEGGTRETKISFYPKSDGNLRIGSESFPVKDGVLVINNSSIPKGHQAPVFFSDNGKTYLCDAIKAEAGSITADIDLKSRVFCLTKTLALLEEKLNALCHENEILREAVFGKTIF